MTVSSAEFLKGSYNAAQLMGDKAVASDGTMVVEGFESMTLLIKQFPWPMPSVMGEIEVPGPQGSFSYQPQQLKTAHQGPIALMETVAGQVHDFAEALVRVGGRFQASVYEGTPERFRRGYKIRDAFVQLDDPDRDYESRSQILLVSGTIFYHFFGEKIPGNFAG